MSEAYYSQQLIRWFRERGVNPKCTQCGKQEFKQGDLVPLQITDETGNPIAGRGYWLFPLACRNCGHIEFFNGDMMGLIPEQYRST